MRQGHEGLGRPQAAPQETARGEAAAVSSVPQDVRPGLRAQGPLQRRPQEHQAVQLPALLQLVDDGQGLRHAHRHEPRAVVQGGRTSQVQGHCRRTSSSLCEKQYARN